MRRSALFLLALAAASALASAAEDGNDFFEKKIRPVLAEKCYKCHSAAADKVKGGLVLDTAEGARRGGDSGPAVVPGGLGDSLLIEAVRYANKDFAMPPAKSGGKLPDEVIHDLEKWVEMGAPDPRTGPAAPALAKQENYEKARAWWAWQAPQAAAPPAVKDAAWPKADLDRFLLAGLEAKGLHPVGDAEKLTLLRRVYFDLIGLPPQPDDINAFNHDASPQALEHVVDRLLASPEYGERWGRHWLDVARFAESSGKDVNFSFPNAWRYRDYVISAFNQDKPFDEFIREQLAGDLLPAKTETEKSEHLIATGFLAIGAKGLNEINPRQFALDLADEQIDATSQAFLGLTVACARCHDHKFDPIPQKDYYSLAGIFLSTDTKYGTPRAIQNRHSSDLLELPATASVPTVTRPTTAAEIAAKGKRLEELKTELMAQFQERRTAKATDQPNLPKFLRTVTEMGMVEAELKSFRPDGSVKPLAMGVKDEPAGGGGGFFGGRFGGGGMGGFGGGMGGRYGSPRPPELSRIGDAAIYARGDADKPGAKTPRGVLTLLAPAAAPIPASQSGRRQLADWIASPQNPLTSRVIVNRVWHWIFGEGLVTSTDNFGTTGATPSNPALLDALAVRFAADGWSVKKLVREIVLSRAYGLASAYEPKAFAADPENALHWRMNKRRLDAECIRDAVLLSSNRLNLHPPTGSVVAQAGDGPIGRRYFGLSEDRIIDSGAALDVRSVYLPITRDLLPDALAVFDFSEPSLVSGNRESTNVPSQALYLLNSPFIAQSARQLATRVLATYPAGPYAGVAASLEPRAALAYWMVYSRPPTPAEQKAAADFFTRFPATFRAGDTASITVHGGEATLAAWTSFCRALYASSEFRYLN